MPRSRKCWIATFDLNGTFFQSETDALDAIIERTAETLCPYRLMMFELGADYTLRHTALISRSAICSIGSNLCIGRLRVSEMKSRRCILELQLQRHLQPYK